MEDIIKQAGNHLGYDTIKPEQLKVVSHFLKGVDCFVILPTGYGKSLCFALLPLVFNAIGVCGDEAVEGISFVTILVGVCGDEAVESLWFESNNLLISAFLAFS